MLSAILYKRCTSCGHQRERAEFHRVRASKDGRDSRCKPCKAPIELAYRRKHAEKKRRLSKEWRLNNPERVAAHQKIRERKFPEKHRARRILKEAVKYGKVEKPTVCPRCGVDEVPAVEMHAHHHDYSKPLEIEWVCRSCHNKEHGHAY